MHFTILVEKDTLPPPVCEDPPFIDILLSNIYSLGETNFQLTAYQQPIHNTGFYLEDFSRLIVNFISPSAKNHQFFYDPEAIYLEEFVDLNVSMNILRNWAMGSTEFRQYGRKSLPGEEIPPNGILNLHLDELGIWEVHVIGWNKCKVPYNFVREFEVIP